MKKEDVERALRPEDRIKIAEQLGFEFRSGKGYNSSGEIEGVALPVSIKGRRDRNASVRFNAYKGTYWDRGGDGEGDLYEAVQQTWGLDFKGALRWVAEQIGFGDAPGEKDDLVPLSKVKRWNERLLNHEALEYLTDNRGLDRAIIKRYLIGLKDDWIFIPLKHDGENVTRWKQTLLDISRLEWKRDDANTKIVKTGGSATLYGARSLVEGEQVVLCEGEIDMLSARQAGFVNAVTGSAGAKTFNTRWARLIAAVNPPRVVIAYDGDEDGQAGAQKAMRHLSVVGLEHIYLANVPDGKDLNDLLVEDPGYLRHVINEAEEVGVYVEGNGAEELELVKALAESPHLIPRIQKRIKDGRGFSDPKHGSVYQKLLKAWGEGGFDAVSFRASLTDQEAVLLERHRLAKSYAKDAAMLETYAGRIADRYERAVLVKNLNRALREIEDVETFDQAKTIAQSAIIEGGGLRERTFRHMKDHVETVRLNLKAWEDGDTQGTYVTTGFGSLNRVLGGGMMRGKLHAFCADSGAGKTSSATESAISVNISYARRGVPVAIPFFSGEMEGPEITEKCAIQLSGVNMLEVRVRGWQGDEEERFHQALDMLEESYIYVEDSSETTPDHMDSVLAELLAMGYEVPAVYADYLGLTANATYGEISEDSVSKTANAWRKLASKYHCAWFGLSQINQKYLFNAPTFTPTPASVRYSQKVYHEAYNVFLWHWPKYVVDKHKKIPKLPEGSRLPRSVAYQPDEPNLGTLIVSKGRGGGAGAHIPLRFYPESTYFVDPQDEEEGETIREATTFQPDDEVPF